MIYDITSLYYRPSICTFMSVYQITFSVVILPFLSLEYMVLSENSVKKEKEKVVLKNNLRLVCYFKINIDSYCNNLIDDIAVRGTVR